MRGLCPFDRSACWPGKTAFVSTHWAGLARIVGSVDAVAVVLDRYRQAGLDYLICDFVAAGLDDLLRQMRVMAEQIMPALASRS
jgi:hypothetical protein